MAGRTSEETREAARALERRTRDVVTAARELCSPGERTRAARSTLAEALADLDAAEARLRASRMRDATGSAQPTLALPENAGRHEVPDGIE